MKNINNDIKNNEIKNIYLLYGEENYLKRQYKNNLYNAIVGDDDTMNYSYFEGKGLDYTALGEMVRTLPFFSDKRLVIVENSEAFKESSEKMNEVISNIIPETCLVFVENNVDKRNKNYKKIVEKGYACEMKKQTPAVLERWVVSLLRKENKKISSGTVQLLISKVGDDMNNIYMEIEKLISYTMGKETISGNDVEEVCTTDINSKIFDMLDAMMQKNKEKVLKLYYDLLYNKEPPMRIMYMITRQLNILLQVQDMTSKGQSQKAIADKLKLQSFIIKKMSVYLRNFSKKKIIAALEDAVNTEEMVKTGRINDRMGVELILINYSK